jgi:hypothetical protein
MTQPPLLHSVPLLLLQQSLLVLHSPPNGTHAVPESAPPLLLPLPLLLPPPLLLPLPQ